MIKFIRTLPHISFFIVILLQTIIIYIVMIKIPEWILYEYWWKNVILYIISIIIIICFLSMLYSIKHMIKSWFKNE